MGTADQGAHSLRAAWDENAEAWLRWARLTELDHAFWHLNLPTLIELLPPPGEITLDVGCGEGRVARALKASADRDRGFLEQMEGQAVVVVMG